MEIEARRLEWSSTCCKFPHVVVALRKTGSFYRDLVRAQCSRLLGICTCNSSVERRSTANLTLYLVVNYMTYLVYPI